MYALPVNNLISLLRFDWSLLIRGFRQLREFLNDLGHWLRVSHLVQLEIVEADGVVHFS